tara:strand:+ start:111 stop:332 length:222 start_codon:yes stop_codon:yes gene_type:complete
METTRPEPYARISRALDDYTAAVKEADRFQQETLSKRPTDQEWAIRDDLDGVADRRRDALLVTIRLAIIGGAS